MLILFALLIATNEVKIGFVVRGLAEEPDGF